MKWLALALMLIVVPLIAGLLRSSPRYAKPIFTLFGFLSLLIYTWKLYVAPYATPFWPGFVKGWEVDFLDAIAIGIVIGIKGPRPPKLLIWAFVLYFLTVLISVHNAPFMATAFSYPFQLMKVALVIFAVTKIAFREDGERALLTGLAGGLVVQLLYALVQKAGGALQTGGGLGHQNLLGYVTHLTMLPLFAAVLAGRIRTIGQVGVGAGLIIVALTASRGTLVISGIGLGLTLMFSLVSRFNGRKIGIAALAFVLVGVALPLAIINLQQRFHVQNSSFGAEDTVRESFERAARMMIAERPGGIGPNHYVFVANTQNFSNRAHVDWSVANRSAIVHNAYLLEAAESGYPGLLTMIFLLATIIWLAFTTAWRNRRSGNSETLIGVGCAFVAISIHNFYEWVFFNATSQYLIAINVGLICGILARQQSYARLTPKPPKVHY